MRGRRERGERMRTGVAADHRSRAASRFWLAVLFFGLSGWALDYGGRMFDSAASPVAAARPSGLGEISVDTDVPVAEAELRLTTLAGPERPGPDPHYTLGVTLKAAADQAAKWRSPPGVTALVRFTHDAALILDPGPLASEGVSAELVRGDVAART